MRYTYSTTYERGCKEGLHNFGYSTRKIAEQIGHHPSAIARELKRNQYENSYLSESAHLYEKRRLASSALSICTRSLHKLIEAKLYATRSPEQITNTELKGF